MDDKTDSLLKYNRHFPKMLSCITFTLQSLRKSEVSSTSVLTAPDQRVTQDWTLKILPENKEDQLRNETGTKWGQVDKDWDTNLIFSEKSPNFGMPRVGPKTNSKRVVNSHNCWLYLQVISDVWQKQLLIDQNIYKWSRNFSKLTHSLEIFP